MRLFEFEDKILEPIYEKVELGTRLGFEDGVTLFNSPDLQGVGFLANIVRERLNGNNAYYIHNRHINPTNICVHSCQFCAFGVKVEDETSYVKSLETIFEDAEKYEGGQVSEFHIVGGLHPDLPYQYYVNMLKGLKSRFPEVHIQAFTVVELEYLARLARMSLHETLIELKDAGLGIGSRWWC